jgi:hypothetical protein
MLGRGVTSWSHKIPFASIHAACRDQERERINLELVIEITTEQSKPFLLRRISELLARLRTFKPGFGDVLKMMNHLVDENGHFGRRLACPFAGR